MNIKILSAGAGSGKTYSLTQHLTRLLAPEAPGAKPVRASGIIATTFTKKAAAELKDRVRTKLLQEGLTEQADALGNALIGTVNAIGAQLLQRFAFEAGVSPQVQVMEDADRQFWFNESLASVLSMERVERMEALAERLSFEQGRYTTDWRSVVLDITEKARVNALNQTTLEYSCRQSVERFAQLLGTPLNRDWERELQELLDSSIDALGRHEDATAVKQNALRELEEQRRELQKRGFLPWSNWVKITKLKTSKKTEALLADLKALADLHPSHPELHAQCAEFVQTLFAIAIDAMEAYDAFKRQRGWIDFLDMEVQLLELLRDPAVRQTLHSELDLLLVDEFQDTSPIQLAIFLELSQIAGKAIWVGDPKQSIYGFRGAAPELMRAVVERATEREALKTSWRSRPDLVHTVNALFTRAFPDEEDVALQSSLSRAQEPEGLQTALRFWHFECADGKKPNKDWDALALAQTISAVLKQPPLIRDRKKGGQLRPLRPSDMAVLCRKNDACIKIAQALHKMGIKASIARDELLQTTEARLALACLRYVVNEYDALSLAEVLRLAEGLPLETIVQDRLNHVYQSKNTESKHPAWAKEYASVRLLDEIRRQSREFSAKELLDWLLEKLDLWRVVAAWGNTTQRHANLDALRSYALQYEESRHSLHLAATPGGFLLWLDELARNDSDEQGKGSGDDAVEVLTYHKSKGLEWAWVVCCDLDEDARLRWNDVRVESIDDTWSPEAPLSGRYLCYWPNPYGQQSRNTRLEERALEHPQMQRQKHHALEEEKRLLYVGLTRARDYLVLPVFDAKAAATAWLNRCFHNGQGDVPVLDRHSEVCPWTWQGEEIPVLNQTLSLPALLSGTPLPEERRLYRSARAGERFHAPALAEQPADLFDTLPELNHIEQHDLYPLPPLPDALAANETLHWQGLAAFVLGHAAGAQPEVQSRRAADFVERYGWATWLEAPALQDYALRFWQFVEGRLGKRLQIRRGLPFVCTQPLRYTGTVELCLQNDQATWLVQPGLYAVSDPQRRRQRLYENALFLQAASVALGLPACRLWVFLPAEAALLELRLSSTASPKHQQRTLFDVSE